VAFEFGWHNKLRVVIGRIFAAKQSVIYSLSLGERLPPRPGNCPARKKHGGKKTVILIEQSLEQRGIAG